jgi:hypothetical protein
LGDCLLWAGLGDCLLWAGFLKIAPLALLVGNFFPSVKVMYCNVLGHILGDICTNVSGHPDVEWPIRAYLVKRRKTFKAVRCVLKFRRRRSSRSFDWILDCLIANVSWGVFGFRKLQKQQPKVQ